MVMDAVRGYVALAAPVGDLSRQGARSAARAMLAGTEATRDQVTALADDLLATSRSNRDAIVTLVRSEIDRGLVRLGLASREDVAELRKQLRALEATVRELRDRPDAATRAPAVKRTGAGTAPAKRAPRAAATTTARKRTSGTAAASTGAAAPARRRRASS